MAERKIPRPRHQLRAAQKPKSDLYRDLLPAINSRKIDLLDHPRLLTQLVGLERRTARGGRDSIDHAAGREHRDGARCRRAAAGAWHPSRGAGRMASKEDAMMTEKAKRKHWDLS